MQNAVKHADGATGVTILLVDDGALRFEVSDDGHGFAGGLPTAGAGLRNISDRITSLGGRLIVDPGLGRGTHLVGSVPVA
jgi:signal transduction histidine kinase